MQPSVSQALGAHFSHAPVGAPLQRLVIAGAGGVLGSALARRLIGSQRYASVAVLTDGPLQAAPRGVRAWTVPAPVAADEAPPSAASPGDPAAVPDAWPPWPADIGVVQFEPPRGRHGRERVLWTPAPAQLPALARWMRRGGVRRLLVLLPHERGRLPDAVRRGIANLDEAALARMDFDCVLLLRAARDPAPLPAGTRLLERLAHGMLGIARYMVPAGQMPLRSAELARVAERALAIAPPGVHVLPPELLRQIAAADSPDALLRAVLGAPPDESPGPSGAGQAAITAAPLS